MEGDVEEVEEDEAMEKGAGCREEVVVGRRRLRVSLADN